ncbi:hypothetical protein GAG94_03320 [Lysinibacillus sphaericus]|nr:hypothetical protein GAG94_03320 [Lysinibacillus sphaericus]
MTKEVIIDRKNKFIHCKGTGLLISKNITSKRSKIYGIGIVFRYKYLMQIAVADELWYDGVSGKKYFLKIDNKTLYMGFLAFRF